jgi:uncharacterized protein (TIGR02453 family)
LIDLALRSDPVSKSKKAAAKASPTSGFAGFRPAALEFFVGLRDHNDPLWFKPRKAIYDTEVLAPFRALLLTLSAQLEAVGIPLVGDPGRGIFRIYRDVRFSANKQLYKTHQGAVLTRSGGKGDPGLLYVHLEPGESMTGVGFWRPEPALLTRLRRAILDDPDGFLEMVGRLDRLGFKVTTDAQLARLPRGFEAAKGTPIADYVCWKTFIVDVALSDAEMQSPNLLGRVVDIALATRPLLDWGWAAEADDIPPPLALRMPTRPLPKPDF